VCPGKLPVVRRTFFAPAAIPLDVYLPQDPEARVRYPALPEKKSVVGLERGPLSFVSTAEELLDRKVAAPV
jgi:hypothetical protein